MYLSKISFTNLPRFLTNPYLQQEHKFVMSLFRELEGDSPRTNMKILYREELKASIPHYLIQSEELPSTEYVKNAGLANRVRLETKQVDDIYSILLKENEISYKVRVNPVKTVERKRKPVRGEDNISSWWSLRAERAGLILDPDRTLVTIEQDRTLKDKIRLSTATITGIAKVEDSESVLNAIKNGIGKEKSYGYGMLMLGRA